MEAVHFEGSSEEKKIRAYLATLGIDYDTLTKEEFVSLIGILKKSKHMKSPISQRGKTTMTHGKAGCCSDRPQRDARNILPPVSAPLSEYGGTDR